MESIARRLRTAAGDANAYIGGLTAYRGNPPGWDDWIIGFAAAAETAAAGARVAGLDSDLRDELIQFRRVRGIRPATPRRDAVVLRILEALAVGPVLTADTVVKRFDVSPAAAHRALTELAEAGILGRTKDQRGRLICWTADRHLALVSLTERSRQDIPDSANLRLSQPTGWGRRS